MVLLESLMMKQIIEQIDQELIRLLGKRMNVLAELAESASSDLEDLEKGSSNLRFRLAQAGVPEFVWQNITNDCTTTLSSRSPLTTEVKPRRVTVIGGSGMMGRFFTQRLVIAGHQVKILEADDWDRAPLLLTGADLVLVCVPIDCTPAVVCQAAQFLSPTTALADVTSIKTPIVQVMLEQHSGPVMGLHPMFGPGFKSFASQKVVVCPGRRDEQFQWLLDLIKSEGGELVFSTPEEHDQMMVAVQAIRNFATLSLGIFLSNENIDIHRSLEFSSPIYCQKIGIVNRLFTQSASLIVDIMMATQERRDAIARLANTYSRLAELVVQEDRENLILEFNAAHNFLTGAIANALPENPELVNAFTTQSAASDVGQRSPILTRVEC
jgi:prephenate dehydrogenase